MRVNKPRKDAQERREGAGTVVDVQMIPGALGSKMSKIQAQSGVFWALDQPGASG